MHSQVQRKLPAVKPGTGLLVYEIKRVQSPVFISEMEQGAAGLWEEGSSAPGQPLSCSTPSALHQPLVITSSPSPRLQHKVNSTCEPQLCTEANCPLVILPYPAPWGVSAYPDSALFPSRKSQNKYWLQSKHDFPLHSWEQVNPPLTLVANPPITQDTRPKSSSAPQRHT